MGIERFTKEEISQIRQEYRDAKNKNTQVGILAELHATDKETIAAILAAEPENLLKKYGVISAPKKERVRSGIRKEAADAVIGGMDIDAAAKKYGLTRKYIRDAVRFYQKQYASTKGVEPAGPADSPRLYPQAGKQASANSTPPLQNKIILAADVSGAMRYDLDDGLIVNGIALNDAIRAALLPLNESRDWTNFQFAGVLSIRIEDLTFGKLDVSSLRDD